MASHSDNADTQRLLADLKLDRSGLSRQSPQKAGYSGMAFLIVAVLLLPGFAGGWVLNNRIQQEPSAPPQVEAANSHATPMGPPPKSEPPQNAHRDPALQATGYVVARQMATVSANVTGTVRAIYIEEGRTIERGDIMATLDDHVQQARLDWIQAELNSTKSAIRVSEIAQRRAQAELDRAESLAGRALISLSNLDDMRAELEKIEADVAVARLKAIASKRQKAVYQAELNKLVIRAPFTGVVIHRTAQVGEVVSPVSAGELTRTGIGTLVDMSSLEVEVDVSETYIQRVQVSQRVEVNLNAYPDITYAGRVLAIIPTADRNKATIKVRIGLDKADAKTLPEMGVKVSFLRS